MFRQNSTMSQVWVPDTDPGENKLILIEEETPNGNLHNDNNNYSNSSKCPDFCRKYRMATSMRDLVSLMFWKALFAEFVGTFFLVLVALGSTVQGWQPDDLDVVQISLSFGLCVATIITIIGHISGGHINPAVTMAMLVTRRISLIKALLYIVFQCAGAVAGAALLKRVTPAIRQGGLGTTTLNVGVSPAMGFGIEFFITMVLVLTVFATCTDSTNVTGRGGSFALTIGLSVTVGHLWAVEFCGASMNPARSFGPAVVMNIWEDHWVYWLGPMTGGIFAGLLYDNILATNASIAKVRDLLLSPQFDAEAYPERMQSTIHDIEDMRSQENMACTSADGDHPMLNP